MNLRHSRFLTAPLRTVVEKRRTEELGAERLRVRESRSKVDGERLGVGRVGRAGVVHNDVAAVGRVADAVADGTGADVDDRRARPRGVRVQDRSMRKTAAGRACRGDVHL